MQYTYEAIFSQEDGGRYSVNFPDLVGCYTCGDDYSDAIAMASDVLALWLSSAEIDGITIPKANFHHPLGDNEERVVMSVATDGYPISITTNEAAQILGVSVGRVRQLVTSGQLQGEKSGRDYMVSHDSVRARAEKPRQAGRPRKELALC